MLKMTKLNKIEAIGKINADTNQQIYQYRSPQQVVDKVNLTGHIHTFTNRQLMVQNPC